MPVRIRPLVWRQWDLYAAFAVDVPILIVGIINRSQLGWALAICIGLIAVVVRGCYRSCVVIDDERVTVVDVAGPGRWARRERIAGLHIFSFWVLLVDGEGKGVLRIRPLYTQPQLQEIAESLAVPVVNRRRKSVVLALVRGRRNAPD